VGFSSSLKSGAFVIFACLGILDNPNVPPKSQFPIAE
jgi:hypothetical protein